MYCYYDYYGDLAEPGRFGDDDPSPDLSPCIFPESRPGHLLPFYTSGFT